MATPTHCPRGHAYDEVNTYWHVRQNGHKTPNCRTCHRARLRAKGKEHHRNHMRKWRASNREHANRTWTDLRAKKKAWLDEYKSTHPCKDCGETHPACLDFHHRNPNEKELTLSLAVARASLERIQKEVAKCDFLCANCHRKHHYKERQRVSISSM